jgi:(S)-ureidoglycine aminohydrolase
MLATPDTFIRAPLPGMQRATAIVHVSPAAGARFTQYTAEFEPGGKLGPPSGERFLYVLQGEIRVNDRRLGPDEYAYLPEGFALPIHSPEGAQAAVIEKPYQESAGTGRPEPFFGDERQVPLQPVMGDDALQVRALIPGDPSFDFAVNIMLYQPGATLPLVEIHVMEHGLLMLSGNGIYRLGEKWYPVTAGDFIWMAPYCPQWFGALGKTPAKYLLYKDWNR